MKIAIDASTLSNPNPAGIEYMTEGVIKGWMGFPENQYFLYTYEGLGLKLPGNFEQIVIPKPTGMVAGLRWYWKVGRDIKNRQIERFVSTYTFSAAIFCPHTVQIIPDLSPVLYPAYSPRKRNLVYSITLPIALLFARSLVTISKTAKDEIRGTYFWFKRETTPMLLAINEWAMSPRNYKLPVVKSKYSLPEKYFLSISTLQPRKNYENTIKAFANFSVSHPDYHYLIVGGKGWYYEQLFKLVSDLHIEAKVHFLGYVPDEDLPALLDNADALLYMSFYEGFGIPLLNALYRGIPVLTSDIPLFHEVAESSITLFADPTNVGHISRQMLGLLKLQKEDFQEEIIKQYNWHKAAEVLLHLK